MHVEAACGRTLSLFALGWVDRGSLALPLLPLVLLTTVLAVPDAILLADHGPSDGFVPAAYAILPGSDAVLALDIDHAGIVLPSPIGHFTVRQPRKRVCAFHWFIRRASGPNCCAIV